MDNNNKTPWWQPALNVFAEVTGWIVFPIIGALYLGKWLDNRYDTEPWFFLGLTFLAFIITSTGVVMIATRYINKIEKETKNKKKNDKFKLNGK